MKTTAVLMKI
jgi:hypothetical protein